MKKTLINNPVKALALAFGLFSSTVFAADAPLKVGTTAAFAIPLEAAVAEAGKQGLKVELVEFTDWIAPNVSLAAGDIDVNYFQHIPFLENAKGASVAIANDPINSGRGLQLLAKAGLITLKPGVGYKATEEDIVANPKHIKILQVEAVQLVRAYDDADLVQGYPAYIRLSKTFDAESALLFDGLDHPEYVIQFVVQPNSKTDPRVIKFVDIYQHSPVVRAALDKSLGKLYQVGWEG